MLIISALLKTLSSDRIQIPTRFLEWPAERLLCAVCYSHSAEHSPGRSRYLHRKTLDRLGTYMSSTVLTSKPILIFYSKLLWGLHLILSNLVEMIETRISPLRQEISRMVSCWILAMSKFDVNTHHLCKGCSFRNLTFPSAISPLIRSHLFRVFCMLTFLNSKEGNRQELYSILIRSAILSSEN